MGQHALLAHFTAHIDLQAGKGIDDNRNDGFLSSRQYLSISIAVACLGSRPAAWKSFIN
jgi:hypothetical protein